MPLAGPSPLKSRLDIITVPAWSRHKWLVHGFSTRTGGRSRAYCSADSSLGNASSGELNLGLTSSDSPANVAANRSLFFDALTGNAAFSAVTLRQVHSSIVYVASRTNQERQPRADAMLTREPGLLLSIQTADCVPILIADRKQRAIAAFHAGWRGTLKRIVETGIGRMRVEFGSRPEDLIAAIGPAIGACCYAVGEEVRSEFESQFPYAPDLFREVYDSDAVRQKYPMLFLTARAPGHSDIGPSLHLDLPAANRRQLLDAGLKASAITMTGECTSCRPDRYFSYRAEHGFTGRMLSVVGVRP
jgi:YfiH family protein